MGSVAHALSYCQAVEHAANCDVPARANALRVLLAELERIYNHLHYLGHLCHTTTLKVGEAQGKLLEEKAKTLNARLTGSRFLRSLLIPGGLRRDLDPRQWLGDALESLREEFVTYAGKLENSESHLDRLITTGLLPQKVAFDQGATGPVARASGIDRDLRRDHPYAHYDGLPLTAPTFADGDAYAGSESASRKSTRRLFCASAFFCFSSRGPSASNARLRLTLKDSDGRKGRAARSTMLFTSAQTAGSSASRSSRLRSRTGARFPSPCTTPT